MTLAMINSNIIAIKPAPHITKNPNPISDIIIFFYFFCLHLINNNRCLICKEKNAFDFKE